MKSLYRKLFIVFVAAVWINFPALAQDAGPKVFTLEECIELALQHNVNIKNERLSQGISKAQVGETLAQGLPQISASGDMTHNIEIPVTFLPGSIAGVPEVDYVPVQFGVPWQAGASIRLDQMIFNGTYFVGLKAAKVFKELAQKNLIKAETDVVEAVSLAYFGALVSEDRLSLLKNNYQRLDSLYSETKAMYENGFAEAIDVQRVKVNLNNVKTEYQNVERSYAINLNALKFQIGIPMNEKISLADDIDDFTLEEPEFEDNDFSYGNRIEYQQLQVTRTLAGLEIKNHQSQYYPSLNAFANYGYNAGKPSLSKLFEETPDISMEVEGRQVLMEGRTWNPYASVGISLRVPIFDGLLKANRIRRAKLEKEQVENQIQNLGISIDMQIEQAKVVYQNSYESLQAQRENMELAQEIFRVAKIKYQEGVGSNLEVIEAENAFKEAETNYFNALYNALVSRISYQKATGTLYQK